MPQEPSARPVATRARFHYGEFGEVWRLIQWIYAKQENDSRVRVAYRRALFRSNLACVFAQIEAVPECRAPMLRSLIDYASGSSGLDGLESILLTLLVSSNRVQDQSLFQQGLAAWKKYGAVTRVPGAGPMCFYNVSNRKLSFFSRKVARSLRSGGDKFEILAYESKIGQSLESLAVLSLDDPFGIGVRGTRSLEREAADGPESRTTAVFKAECRVTGAALVATGVLYEVIPIPEPFHVVVGTAYILTGLVLEAIPEVMDLAQAVQDLSSSEVDLPPDDQPDIDSGVVVGGTDADGSEGVGVYDDGGDWDDPIDQGGPDGGVDEDGGGGCFIGDTLVSMGDGSYKPISDVAVGDEVIAWHAGASCMAKCKVTTVHRHEANDLIRLAVGQDNLGVTAMHRFATGIQPLQFTSARGLASGHCAVDAQGAEIPIHAVARGAVRATSVYNLSVEDAHTYYVGTGRILVHNLKDNEPEEPIWEAED